MAPLKLFVVILGICSNVLAFAPPVFSSSSRKASLTVRFEFQDDSAPSDYDAEDLPPEQKEVTVDDNEEDSLIRDALKRELLLLASVTNRGGYANDDENGLVLDLVSQLEALNPTANPASHCVGDWDLCFASTQLFRSSPFFQAIRVAVGDENKQIAENGFSLHARATSGGSIGRVRQTITSDTLTSEVDLIVGLLPGIPFKITGTVVTTAGLNIVSDELMELKVESTKVKGSNIPIVNQIMEEQLQLEVPVGTMYSSIGSEPVIPMHTFYVDESMRIVRDIDENFFVYTRV